MSSAKEIAEGLSEEETVLLKGFINEPEWWLTPTEVLDGLEVGPNPLIQRIRELPRPIPNGKRWFVYEATPLGREVAAVLKEMG